MSAVHVDELAAEIAIALESSSRKWRSQEEHALAVAQAIEDRGWRVVEP